MLIKLPLVTLLKTGWRYAGNRRHLIAIYFLLFACAEATGLAEPWVIGKLLNCVQSSAQHGFNHADELLHQIYIYLGLLFLTQTSFWAFHGPGRLIERYVSYHIKAAYKTKMFALVTELPLQWHRGNHSGDSIDKINKASNSLSAFFDSTFEVSYMIFRFIGAQVILFCFMPIAAWASLAASMCSVATIVIFDKMLFKQYKQLNGFDNRIAAGVHDYVTNIISIITLRLEDRVTAQVKRRMLASVEVFKKTNVINETKWCLTTLTIGFMTMIVMTVYATTTLHAHQALMTGTFFTLFEYLRRIGESFYNFAALYGTTVQQVADIESADPLFESHKQMAGGLAPSGEMPRRWNEVEVRDLYFTYADDKQRVHHLENVALDLTKGKAIAFVGESGSGKSTLLNLLRGLQSADRARVLCDKKPLPDQLRHLSHVTTLLPQDPEIFADTIRFNITFGLDASDEEIENAIKIAKFESVLSRLPNGLDTNISEGGVNLSGGEKQRLALARGLFFAKDSDVVLLDEPTSSVDQKNERMIYKNILREFRGACIVSSIHKLNLLDLFDYVYVFANGQVAEQGTLSELLAINGHLSSLWQQADSDCELNDNDLEVEVETVSNFVLEPASTL